MNRTFVNLVIPSFVIGLVLLSSVVGCGKKGELPPREDTSFIGEVISNVSEYRTTPEKFAGLFTEDGLPDEDWIESAADKSFLIDEIEMTGDQQATVSINVENHFAEPVGTVTWTCVLAGDSWKISDSPLP